MDPSQQTRTADNADSNHEYNDVAGWWAAFRRGGFSRGFQAGPDARWVFLYYKPGLQYRERETGPFTVHDFMGREERHTRPFDCTVDPLTCRIVPLCVQAPDSICALSAGPNPNCTWSRTVMRNAAPNALWAAELLFMFVPPERRGDFAQYTLRDKATVVGAWIFIAVPMVFLSVSLVESHVVCRADARPVLGLHAPQEPARGQRGEGIPTPPAKGYPVRRLGEEPPGEPVDSGTATRG